VAQVVETITDPVAVLDPDDSVGSATDPTRSASAYECNGANQKIIRTTRVQKGETVKICVAPSRETMDDDVFLLKIANFEFLKPSPDGLAKNVIKQGAVKDGIVSDDERTTMSCFAGATVCSLSTVLQDDFFDTDGEVRGRGEVALQFGRDTTRRQRVQQRTLLQWNLNLGRGTEDVSSVKEEQQQRHLRGTTTTTTVRTLQDDGFAGFSDVLYKFNVEDGFKGDSSGGATQDEDDGKRDSFRDHWHKAPNYMQALYVLAILVFCIILCCLCGACILWERCCADAPAYVRHKIARVTRGTVFQEDYAAPRTAKKNKQQQEEEWDSTYPKSIPDDEGQSSSDDSVLSDVDEDMLLDNKPHKSPPKSPKPKVGGGDVEKPLMLMNEPHVAKKKKKNEKIGGKLLLTAVPHETAEGAGAPKKPRSSKQQRTSVAGTEATKKQSNVTSKKQAKK
jgi:hypothetical protein